MACGQGRGLEQECIGEWWPLPRRDYQRHHVGELICAADSAVFINEAAPRDACSFFWQRRKMRAHDFPAPVFLCENQCGAAMDCLHIAVNGEILHEARLAPEFAQHTEEVMLELGY